MIGWREASTAICRDTIPDSKVYGTSEGPIWGRQDPGGPNVGPMNLAIWNDMDSGLRPLILKDIIENSTWTYLLLWYVMQSIIHALRYHVLAKSRLN